MALADRLAAEKNPAREVTALLREAAGLAASLATPAEPEPERQPMGFTVITERGDEPAAESYFTDDD